MATYNNERVPVKKGKLIISRHMLKSVCYGRYNDVVEDRSLAW